MKVSAFPVTSFPPQLWSRLLIRRMDSDFHLIRLTFLAKGGSKIILFWADKSSKALKHAGKDLVNLLAELLWLLISRSPCWQPLPGAWWGGWGLPGVVQPLWVCRVWHAEHSPCKVLVLGTVLAPLQKCFSEKCFSVCLKSRSQRPSEVKGPLMCVRGNTR